MCVSTRFLENGGCSGDKSWTGPSALDPWHSKVIWRSVVGGKCLVGRQWTEMRDRWVLNGDSIWHFVATCIYMYSVCVLLCPDACQGCCTAVGAAT